MNCSSNSASPVAEVISSINLIVFLLLTKITSFAFVPIPSSLFVKSLISIEGNLDTICFNVISK